MTVAAVTPVWNGREWLERMLTSLVRQTRPVAELIVVDNGSTDGARDLARERGARLVLASHLGRPKGKPDPKYTLRPVAAKLAELLGAPVDFDADCGAKLATKLTSYVIG